MKSIKIGPSLKNVLSGIFFAFPSTDTFCRPIVFYHIVKVVKRKLIVFSVVDTHPSKYGSDICGALVHHIWRKIFAPIQATALTQRLFLGESI